MKRTIRLTESDLHRIIKESVKRALNETELNYDVDNFSGKNYKNPPEEIDPTGYLDDPNTPPGSGEDWADWANFVEDEFGGDHKAAENAYSWGLHDNSGFLPDGNKGRMAYGYDADSMFDMNNDSIDTEERVKTAMGRHEKKKWLNGAKDDEMFDFLHNGVYGESKLRNIVRESILHRVIKESVKRIVREWQFDNDLDYQKIYDDACDFLSGNHGLTHYGWREIAEELGFRMDSIGPNDMETLKDAIEDAMYEIDAPATEKADVDFEYDMHK